MQKQLRAHIYTDGACSGNPGKGGWAWVLHYNDQFKARSGFDLHTTNNQMEMMAVIQALKFAAEMNLSVTLFTDSVYVKNGLLEWVKNWKKRNWLTADKKPVKNKELWMQLDLLFTQCNKNQEQVLIEWVKGHSCCVGNNIADMIATCSVNHNQHNGCKCSKYLA